MKGVGEARASSTLDLAKRLGISRQSLIRAVAQAKTEPITSRDGKLGQIVLDPQTGIAKYSLAARAIRRLETACGGKYDVAEKLQAAGNLIEAEKRLIELIMKKSRSRARLVTLVAEAGCDAARIIRLYAEGAVALGKAEALAITSQHLGAMARQLVKQATFNKVSCNTCLGAGVVPTSARKGPVQPNPSRMDVCPSCRGKKELVEVDKHYKFAVSKILDMAALGQEGPAVNVQTNVAVQQSLGSSGFMEKLSKLTDGNGGLSIRVLPVEEAPPGADDAVLQEDSPVEAG